jgi:hypothetical protein
MEAGWCSAQTIIPAPIIPAPINPDVVLYFAAMSTFMRTRLHGGLQLWRGLAKVHRHANSLSEIVVPRWSRR